MHNEQSVVQGPPDATPEVTGERQATLGHLSAAEQDTLSMHSMLAQCILLCNTEMAAMATHYGQVIKAKLLRREYRARPHPCMRVQALSQECASEPQPCS